MCLWFDNILILFLLWIWRVFNENQIHKRHYTELYYSSENSTSFEQDSALKESIQ